MAEKEAKTGRDLEARVADAYRWMGAKKVEHDVLLAGSQIDVYVEHETPDRGQHRIAVEVKDHVRPVGRKIVGDFSDIVDRLRRERLIDEGVVVSASGFSREARDAAKEHDLRLLEPADLDAVVKEAKVPGPTAPAEPTADSLQAIPLSKQTEYQYDVFISHSHADLEWVRDELLPRLERAGLKTIIGRRDFEPGAPLVTEMRRAVLESRKTVVVLTPAYLSSEWTQSELILVRTLDPVGLRRRILPVLLQPCEIPLDIWNLVYIDFRPPQPYEVQFQRLIRAITTDVPTCSSVDLPSIIDIPAGLFWIGSPLEDAEAHDNEKPRRKLNLREYQIGRYPVTNTQYACFIRNTGHRVPKHWDEGKVPDGLADDPVVNVSHADAEAYCRWLSRGAERHYRLPTEEEWEKAARGGFPEARRYPWGDEWQADICNTRELGRNRTTSVHEFEQTNQSPFGVMDMAGSVWEWTASWYEKYPGSFHQSPQYGRHYRVVRGGSWQNSSREARISCRGRYKPRMWRPYLGFRIASD